MINDSFELSLEAFVMPGCSCAPVEMLAPKPWKRLFAMSWKKTSWKERFLGFNLVNKVLTIFTQGKSLHIVPRYFLNAPTEVKIEVDLSFLWDIHVLRRSFIKRGLGDLFVDQCPIWPANAMSIQGVQRCARCRKGVQVRLTLFLII